MSPFVSPFLKRPVADWIDDLQRATSAEDRYRALLAVNSIGTRQDAIPWCRHALSDADSSVRALGAKMLGELKRRNDGDQPDVDSTWRDIAADLSGLLTDADPDVRFEAARALGRIDASRDAARSVLLSLLGDDGTQPLMIAAVVAALGEQSEVPSDALMAVYRKLLAHEQAEVRESVSAALVALGVQARDFVAELLVALDDEEPIVRENAARALGRANVDSPDVVAGLAEAVSDEDEGVAAAAREALDKLSSQR